MMLSKISTDYLAHLFTSWVLKTAIDVELYFKQPKREVLLLDMVDNSTSPLQTHFWLVFGDEAVLTGLLFPA